MTLKRFLKRRKMMRARVELRHMINNPMRYRFNDLFAMAKKYERAGMIVCVTATAR